MEKMNTNKFFPSYRKFVLKFCNEKRLKATCKAMCSQLTDAFDNHWLSDNIFVVLQMHCRVQTVVIVGTSRETIEETVASPVINICRALQSKCLEL